VEYQYIPGEETIATNRVLDAISQIRKRNNFTSMLQVAKAIGHHWRVLYRLQKHRVLPLNCPYLKQWSELSGRPIEYLTGEWK
jgi:hypothetical protein